MGKVGGARTQTPARSGVKGLLLGLAFVLALCVCLLSPRGAQDYHIDPANADGFRRLLGDLLAACEQPSPERSAAIEADLRSIAAADREDGELAASIAGHWRQVYLDPDYRLRLHHGEPYAEELEETAIPDSVTHAFVVLGFELENGGMRPELKGRCEAAAAAARRFPRTILICSGGATGSNNPERHTEAGLMKDYLVRQCGIDPARIFIDERAMTTAENARNSLEIMRRHGVCSMTVVTSAYHQRWGQVLYHAMAELYRLRFGHGVELLENYCYDTPAPSEFEGADARIAISQLAQLLELPAKRVNK